MSGSEVIAFPLLLLLPAVALLRAGWSGDSRLAYAGWAVGAFSLIWLTMLDGAWGLAVGFVLAIAAALAIVLHTAATSPAKSRRAIGIANVAVEPGRVAIGRRLLVFALVVPVSVLAAQWFAFGLNAVMKGGAPLEANSVATAFMVQPVVWTLLMVWQVCQTKPSAMVWPPVVVASLGTVLWVAA